MKHLLFCSNCEKYTLNKVCACASPTILARPPKYSPDDKYAAYRRRAKEKVA